MFKRWLEKYIGSTRLFFSLISFLLTVAVVIVSFWYDYNLTSQQVSLVLGALSSAMAYIAVETIRKS